MPPVRNLTPDAPAAAPAAVIAVPTPAALVPSFVTAMPAIPDALDDVRGEGTGPYLSCANEFQGKWDMLKAQGFAEGEFYVVLGDEIVKTHPCRFFLLVGDLFKTNMNSAGVIADATRDMTADAGLKGLKVDEHIVAVVLVFVGKELVPAIADFRRTGSKPGITGMQAVRAAGENDWIENGPGEKSARLVAAAYPSPAARVVMTANTTRRTSRSTGNPYYFASASVAPATADELKLFDETIKDAAKIEALNVAKAAFDAKVTEYDRKSRPASR